MRKIRAKDITSTEYKFLERDWQDTCANYALRTKQGTIKVQTLYRFSKNTPVMEFTPAEFNAWRKRIENTIE